MSYFKKNIDHRWLLFNSISTIVKQQLLQMNAKINSSSTYLAMGFKPITFQSPLITTRPEPVRINTISQENLRYTGCENSDWLETFAQANKCTPNKNSIN